MNQAEYTSEQQEIIRQSLNSRIFLSGPAGCGKTTAGVARLEYLVENGVPAEQILVLIPQRTLGKPYLDLIRRPDFPAGGLPDVVTLGGLAQRMIRLFWPLIAGSAGFSQPRKPPNFLTLESAQYFLARLVRPLLEQGYFETIHLDRNRLLSQILDNLNKSAGVGFESDQIAGRLKSAWVGKPEQLHVYDEAQECADLFRQYCYQNNFLDFSLQLHVFTHHLWPSFICREYLFARYRHLIFDNVEEDVPVVHDILTQWLGQFESALLIYDREGGYRSFLGADPETGWTLQDQCGQVLHFEKSLVSEPRVEEFRQSLEASLRRLPVAGDLPDHRPAMRVVRKRFVPLLLDWVAGEIRKMVEVRHVPPGEIAVLAPYLSDALRFSLMDRLEALGISARSHRPSRSLREEPATLCLLTLAQLAHPLWNLRLSRYDVRAALLQSIQDLDLVRADVLAQIVFSSNRPQLGLTSFEKIQGDVQERITYRIGQRYQVLQHWLVDYRQGEPEELDIFLSRLFGEVLSQPGFGFHRNFDGAAVAARLVESVQKFRRTVGGILNAEGADSGLEYLRMVSEGVIAAQYLNSWQEAGQDAVYIAPAYTFLMENRPVSFQFWLDIGSLGWWERLYQPLTHPVVLSRRWPEGRLWTDADEYAASQEALLRLTSGLLRRCQQKVYLCASGLNERGDEPRGPLLQAIQMILRRNPVQEDEDAVSD